VIPTQQQTHVVSTNMQMRGLCDKPEKYTANW